MGIFIYTIYGILLIIFLVLAGFAVRHAIRYEYISPRVKPITIIFIVVSIALIGVSIYFLTQLQF